MKDTDKEYLSRPLINNITYINTSDKIYVSCEHTLYLRHDKVTQLKQSDILNNYSELVKLCRALKIKISYKNKCKQRLLEVWDAYLKEKKEEARLFSELNKGVEELQKRGLHSGTRDDVVLTTCLEISHKLDTLYWRTSAISHVLDIDRHIRNLLEEVKMQEKTDIYGKFTLIVL